MFARRLVMILAAFGAALVGRHGVARAGQATCSNPGLPVGSTASSDLLPGRLTLGLTTGLLVISGDELVDEPAGQVRYASRLTLVETRLSAELAVRSWLAIGGALPLRIVDVGVDYLDPSTGAALPGGSSTHIRDEQLRGLGDPSLHVHAAREVAGLRLHARVGGSLPVGSTVDNPHLLGMIGQEHQHVQLGTGTVVPFVAGEVQRAFGSITGAAWGLAYLSLYDNAHGFRVGHRISGGLTASSRLGTRAFTFGLAAEVHGETAERWDGVAYPEEGNNGRIDTLLGGSVAWRPLPELAVVADLKVPVYSHDFGNQLDYGPVLGLGVIGTFELAPRASYRGADVAVAGPPGTAPALVPVPGKITVFDLWATWCAPCRELDAGLAELSRAHPDRLAVRKLDVVDTDSAAWARYLAPGGFDLPHLVVYGADGALLFERSAPPAQLVRDVAALLR